MATSLRPAILLLFALACHGAPTTEPSTPVDSTMAAEIEAPPEPVPKPLPIEPVPEPDELLAQRNATVEAIARVGAEIEQLAQARSMLRARERELRSTQAIDDSLLQEVLDELDRHDERIAELRAEQAEHRKRSIELDHALRERRENECRDCFDPRSQFRVSR